MNEETWAELGWAGMLRIGVGMEGMGWREGMGGDGMEAR